MKDVIQFAILGLGAGALYSIFGVGLVLIYRSSGIVNFAHGSIGLVGTFFFYELSEKHGWSYGPALFVGILASMAAAIVTYLIAIRPLRDASPLAQLIATLAVQLIILAAANLRYGFISVFVPSELPTSRWHIFGAAIGADRVLLLVLSAAMVTVLWAAYRFTSFGLRTSAVAENRAAASYLGVSGDLVAGVNWMIAGGLAGVAGILLVPISGLTVSGLNLLIIPALASALVGGMTSFPLTLAGGVAVGVLQSEAGRFLGNSHYVGTSTPVTGLSDAVPLLVIILAMVLRRRGVPTRTALRTRLPRVGTGRRRIGLGTAATAVIVVVVLLVANPAWTDAVTLLAVTGIVLLSFVVVTGYAGQLSLAQFAIAGCGGLIAARFSASTGVPFLVAIVLGMVFAIPIGLIVGVPALRTRGINLAVITLAISVALQSMVFQNLSLAGGSSGIPVHTPNVFGLDVDDLSHPKRYLTMCAVLLLLSALGVSRIRRATIGLRMLAVRSNERAASALGVNIMATKLCAFALASVIAALGGSLMVFRAPNAIFSGFTSDASVQGLAQAVIGGIGFIVGPVFGGSLQTGSVGSRLLNSIAGDDVNNWLYLISGVLLLVTLLTAPDGVARANAELVARVARLVRRPKPTVAVTGAVAVTSPVTKQAAPSAYSAEVLSAETPKGLRVRDMTVRFGGVVAVDSISLEVDPGQIVGLIGPNGAGKTTLLDAISGFVPMAHGSVELGSVRIDGWSPNRRSNAGLGRSFQSLELFDDLTVLENFKIAAEPLKPTGYLTIGRSGSRSEQSNQIEAVCAAFGLTEHLGANPSELGYGQRRLVAIARAAVSRPAVLLLDEPGAGLDDTEKGELLALVRGLARDAGMAVLIIEHDVDFMMSLCNHITVLNFGKHVSSGVPAVVRTDPAVIEAYLGESPTTTDEVEALAESAPLDAEEPLDRTAAHTAP